MSRLVRLYRVGKYNFPSRYDISESECLTKNRKNDIQIQIFCFFLDGRLRATQNSIVSLVFEIFTNIPFHYKTLCDGNIGCAMDQFFRVFNVGTVRKSNELRPNFLSNSMFLIIIGIYFIFHTLTIFFDIFQFNDYFLLFQVSFCDSHTSTFRMNFENCKSLFNKLNSFLGNFSFDHICHFSL